ncbi:MAG: acyltransferase [Opitutae bacterium]|nr:acyltransferase [Opitutae bacterium]MCD8299382.1 acyltransferase [Opitutae bacterium]
MVVALHVSFPGFLSTSPHDFIFPSVGCFLSAIGVRGNAGIAVPFFFFISGYLFFLNTTWSKETYFKKLKKRFWTLYIPLVCWGVPYLVVRYLSWRAGLLQHDAFGNYTVVDFALDFVLGRQNGPFWFIHALIISCLLSPILFWLIKKFGIAPVIVFGLMHFYWAQPSYKYHFGPDVLLFFCFGAYFAIRQIDFTKFFSSVRIPVILLYFAVVAVNIADVKMNFLHREEPLGAFIWVLGSVAGFLFVGSIFALLLEKFPKLAMPKILQDSMFFVYGGHMLFLPLLRIFVLNRLSYETPLSVLAAYVGSIIFAIAACVLLSIVVRKFAPWSVRFLTGGR